MIYLKTLGYVFLAGCGLYTAIASVQDLERMLRDRQGEKNWRQVCREEAEYGARKGDEQSR